MARAGARALWSLSLSRHNKELMRKSGIVPLMARLLKSCHTDVVIPIMGTIQECASQVRMSERCRQLWTREGAPSFG